LISEADITIEPGDWPSSTGIETERSVEVEISTTYEPGATEPAVREKDTVPFESAVAVAGAVKPVGTEMFTSSPLPGVESVAVIENSTVLVAP
jgi:hypothetical protein